MLSVFGRQTASENNVTETFACGVQSPLLAPKMRRKQVVTALLLTFIAFCIYNANLRLISAGDNYPARYLPFAILKHRTLSLDPIADLVSQSHPYPYWCVDGGKRLYSRYPITVPVLVLPLYIPAVAYLDRYGWSEDRLEATARVMEKLSASLIASLSVGLMYLLLVRRTNCRWPLLLTIAYGFGTNTWMIGSQALWQHGMAELLVGLTLFLVLGRCTPPRALVTGICLALVAASRPPDAILAASMGIFALSWARSDLRMFVLGVLLPLVVLLTYNYRVAHHLLGGYSLPWNGESGLTKFRYSVIGGFLGMLFSPARGLIVFSPFLLFFPIGLYHRLRQPRERVLSLLITAAVVVQIALYAKLDWRAGFAWGPRWLTDMLPLLIWILAAGLGKLQRLGQILFAISVCLSIGIQCVGAFWYNGTSDRVILQQAGDPFSIPAVWDYRNTPFVLELSHKPPPSEMLMEFRGSIDRVRVNGSNVEQIVAGSQLEIEGWTLTDRRSPIAVEITLLPTVKTRCNRNRPYPIEGTTSFFERPDVTEAMQGKGPSGWRVLLNTDGLEPGPHSIEVRALGNTDGEGRHVIRRPILVLPESLESSSRLAAARVRDRQHADGYWLTSHTKSTRFEQPTPEMNLFVTSIINEALDPVAKTIHLEKNLSLTRRHIQDQIEASGLVRYHGRPDSPTIPSLGPVITPDADDTSLAWRIAGPKGDGRLESALRVLKSYRTQEGLYRTWLAPQSEYISIDPGKDPNPTDIGIQMHVLMLLDQVDSAAAKSLHQAMQKAIIEDRIWVYYKRAPLVPLWRAAELANLAYPLRFPQDRLRTAAAGQEIWVEACRLLAIYISKEKARPDPAVTRELLAKLARNDFAVIRSNPPLLFHNDLTASVSRYYWSEDFGYALWLRLYLEMEKSIPAGEPTSANG